MTYAIQGVCDDDPTLRDLGGAATAVTKALDDLMQHIKKGSRQGRDVSTARLTRHWNTFKMIECSLTGLWELRKKLCRISIECLVNFNYDIICRLIRWTKWIQSSLPPIACLTAWVTHRRWFDKRAYWHL